MASQRGVALVLVLLATVLLTAVAVVLVLVTSVEVQVARSFRDGQEALQAAEAGLERAALELEGTALWDDVLSGAARSGMSDTTTRPLLPGGGGPVDLGAITAELQRDPDRRRPWGTAAPIWRLYAWGPAADIFSGNAADSRLYVAVWVADDPSDRDDNPLADTNGAVALHAEAYGFGGIRRSVEAIVARRSDASGVNQSGLRLIAWEEVR